MEQVVGYAVNQSHGSHVVVGSTTAQRVATSTTKSVGGICMVLLGQKDFLSNLSHRDAPPNLSQKEELKLTNPIRQTERSDLYPFQVEKLADPM
jgi:hypothetical protein